MALKATVPAAVTPLPALRRRLLFFSSSSSSSRAAASKVLRISAAMATAVQPAVVVGGGRVGQALLGMGPLGGDVLVGRGEKVLEGAPTGPILVCTRNDDLDCVLEATPKSRWRGMMMIAFLFCAVEIPYCCCCCVLGNLLS